MIVKKLAIYLAVDTDTVVVLHTLTGIHGWVRSHEHGLSVSVCVLHSVPMLMSLITKLD